MLIGHTGGVVSRDLAWGVTRFFNMVSAAKGCNRVRQSATVKNLYF